MSGAHFGRLAAGVAFYPLRVVRDGSAAGPPPPSPGAPSARAAGTARGAGDAVFWAAKRTSDFLVALAALPVVAALALLLAAVNPAVNPGPVLFRQERMGRHGRSFTILKFRTMRPDPAASRGPDDPLETGRITPLGRWLRRSRIDELPQVWNVLRGEMSLIGPRPDIVRHARAFAVRVPGYAARHAVRPGMSGLAQVTLGYAEGFGSAARKTALDNHYIAHAGWRLEARIVIRTLAVIGSGFGAR